MVYDDLDIGAAVIDDELTNDVAASAFRQRFITLNGARLEALFPR
jgi:hypothetical protein